MKTSSKVMWGVGALAVMGIGLAVASTASAAEDTTTTGNGEDLTGEGTRHGVRYRGCEHFELVDADAIESWARSNAWTFAKWLPRLDELRTDPEPALVEAMAMLFPECPWPPPATTTFGPQRVSWAAAVADAKAAMADLDLAGGARRAPSLADAGSAVAKALALSLRAQPAGRRRG